jgi:hypothetical protein
MVGRIAIIDCDYREITRPVFGGERVAQICRKGRNSALPGKMVPDDRYSELALWAGR